jgi:methyl-accepting chemotaxis protein
MLMSRPARPPKAIGVNLILFFAFALAALVLLTHILVDVARARASVADAVRPAVAGIEADTALLPELARTSKLTGRLAAASQGVNNSLTSVVAATRHIDATILHVRSGTQSIAGSVSSIAGSAATVNRRLANLDGDVSSIHDRARQTAAEYAAVSRAVATLPDDLPAAAANVRALARVIPSITRLASAIVATLTKVDGHLVNINANGIIRLTNLLQLSNLLGSTR